MSLMMRKRIGVIFILAVVAMMPYLAIAAEQSVEPARSWLDRPLLNWNRQGNELPQLPRPVREGESSLDSRCREQVRLPAVAAERAVVQLGWTLYGPAQIFANVRVFTAMAGVDGMCRPLGYQAFVYMEGRYAGTLSPVPMNSRNDGALTTIRLVSATRIFGEFIRYRDSDPLCCPSSASRVTYSLRNDEIPALTAVSVTPSAK
jgi:LppP/LprE lipoprotein